MIKLMMTGHLGKDAIVNQTEGGHTVINFNVAHTSKYKDKNGTTMQKTTWVYCSYWTQQTGIAPYLKKGTQVFIEGEPEVEWYNSNGTEGIVAKQKCRVFKVELLGSAKNEGQSPAQQVPGGPPSFNQQPQNTQSNLPDPANITEPIDDLPF